MAKHHKIRFHISQFYNGQHTKTDWTGNEKKNNELKRPIYIDYYVDKQLWRL